MCAARLSRRSTVFVGAALVLCPELALGQRPAPDDRRTVIPPAPIQAPIARGAAPIQGLTLDATNTVADWRRYPRIARGETKSGVWGDPDDEEWNYKYYDGWVYVGRAGERLVVTAVSSYEPIIYVYAAGANDTVGPSPSGRLIARSGRSTNSRVALILPASGEYLVVALSSYEDKSGTYTLATESSQVIEVAGGPTPRSSADIALSSRCEASNQRVQVTFACPPGWVPTHWQDEYSFRQVNYRHPADWHIALNVRLYGAGIPVSLWGKSSEVFFNARDFVRKTQVEVYGLQGDSVGQELPTPIGTWRTFSALVTNRSGSVSPRYGNLIPVDWMLEMRTLPGSTTLFRDVREGYDHWRDNLDALLVDPIRGTRHAYGVVELDGTLVVITLAGPPEVATDDLLRSVIESVRVTSNP